jgi:methionyl-tRNA formyltransferase
MRAAESPVKRFAVEHGLRVLQPPTLRDQAEQIRAARADAMVVAAYGLLLPPAVLEATRLGAFNIHASLLPRWRGAAPIQRALLAGDAETGISIMQMDAGLDTGPVVSQHRVPISRDDDFGTLHDKLAALGAEAMVGALADVEGGRWRAVAQPTTGVTYAAKIDKRETRLDWTRPAVELERAVRAFRPVPGASAQIAGEVLKIWRAELCAGEGEPGGVLSTGDSVVVACGESALRITELQRAGGRRVGAAEFLRGRALR